MPFLDWVVLVVGTGLGIVSLLADLLGIGGYPGFGWKQVVGTIIGLGLVGLAAARIIRRDRSRHA